MSQTVHLIYAYPLDRDRRALAEAKNQAYPSIEEVKAIAQHWRELWDEVNERERITLYLSSLTQTTLPYPIEAFIIGGLMNAMSTPLLLPVQGRDQRIRTDESFLDMLVHELTHRYASRFLGYPGIEAYYATLREKFPHESQKTTDHLITYALLEKIVPDLLGSSVWQHTQIHYSNDYQRAMELVRTLGADACIQEFRSFL